MSSDIIEGLNDCKGNTTNLAINARAYATLTLIDKEDENPEIVNFFCRPR